MSKPKTVVTNTTTEAKQTVAPETVQQVPEIVPEVNTETVTKTEVIEEQKPKIENAPDVAEKDECIYCGGVCETTEFYANDKPFCCAEHAALYADVMKGR